MRITHNSVQKPLWSFEEDSSKLGRGGGFRGGVSESCWLDSRVHSCTSSLLVCGTPQNLPSLHLRPWALKLKNTNPARCRCRNSEWNYLSIIYLFRSVDRVEWVIFCTEMVFPYVRTLLEHVWDWKEIRSDEFVLTAWRAGTHPTETTCSCPVFTPESSVRSVQRVPLGRTDVYEQ